jgi:hypothetical protein
MQEIFRHGVFSDARYHSPITSTYHVCDGRIRAATANCRLGFFVYSSSASLARGEACALAPFVYSASWPWRERDARLLVTRPGGGESSGPAVGERNARRDSGQRVL